MNNDNDNPTAETTQAQSDDANHPTDSKPSLSSNSGDRCNNRIPTREELLALIKEHAQRLGRTPKLREFRALTGLPMTSIWRHFGSYRKALIAGGFEHAGSGHKVTVHELFLEWAAMVRELGEAPTLAEYEVRSKYSRHPLRNRFGGWAKIAPGMLQYAREAGLEHEWGDVIAIVRRACAGQSLTSMHANPGPLSGGASVRREGSASVSCFGAGPDGFGGFNSSASLSASAGANPNGTSRVGGVSGVNSWSSPRLRDDRPVYGPPLRVGCVGFAPNNESCVMFLFATLAERLGFFMTYIGTKFPDAEAIREVMPGKWQLVRMEFEYESRTFVDHRHDPAKCDLIVCWEHNWPECPLEVLELKQAVSTQHSAISQTQNL